ncbi:peptidoglycan-associated lipoprotein [Bryocella elongata]|uniref:Peptidoglycan-associated lipoprotein n=1 Tax=Bryocella elongata TaxID=863522 RepID=A0A1H5U2Y9_9BACT|nr:OmpA family protein [Bryocella elongata]SEF69380.1 peptidoglycan-associated lipoprotein [Bryocella elongata]
MANERKTEFMNGQRMRTAIVAGAAALLMLTAAGCKKKVNDLPPANTEAPSSVPAPTASISADPLAIDLGQSVVLNWRTTNATSVSIDGIGQVNVNGTTTVSPANSTNFHLVAKGDGGTTEANVRVTVRIPEAPTGPTGNDDGNMGSEAEFKANVKDLFFDYDSYELRPDAQSSVSSAARYLNAHPAVKVLVAGYCDDRGSAEYNITLGENRANSAKTALVNAGVSPNRVRVVSYGKERQFCTEESESCWQQNRRDQFSLDR